MNKKTDDARVIIAMSIASNKSIPSILDFLELRINLTDADCMEIARETPLSYFYIRAVFV